MSTSQPAELGTAAQDGDPTLDAIVTEAIRKLPVQQRLDANAADVTEAIGFAVRQTARLSDGALAPDADIDQEVSASVARCLPMIDPLSGYQPDAASLDRVVEAAVRCVPSDKRKQGVPVVAGLVTEDVLAVSRSGGMEQVGKNGSLDVLVRESVRTCLGRLDAERKAAFGADFDAAEALPEGVMRGSVTKVVKPHFAIVEVTGAKGKKTKFKLATAQCKQGLPIPGTSVTVRRRADLDEADKDPSVELII